MLDFLKSVDVTLLVGSHTTALYSSVDLMRDRWFDGTLWGRNRSCVGENQGWS